MRITNAINNRVCSVVHAIEYCANAINIPKQLMCVLTHVKVQQVTILMTKIYNIKVYHIILSQINVEI